MTETNWHQDPVRQPTMREDMDVLANRMVEHLSKWKELCDRLRKELGEALAREEQLKQELDEALARILELEFPDAR